MTTGAEMIAEERQRQLTSEGWTAEHDDGHMDFELTQAALVYAEASVFIFALHEESVNVPDLDAALAAVRLMFLGGENVGNMWPPKWESAWLKLSPDPIRNLIKAGALIAAEIDRLQRVQEQAAKEGA